MARNTYVLVWLTTHVHPCILWLPSLVTCTPPHWEPRVSSTTAAARLATSLAHTCDPTWGPPRLSGVVARSTSKLPAAHCHGTPRCGRYACKVCNVYGLLSALVFSAASDSAVAAPEAGSHHETMRMRRQSTMPAYIAGRQWLTSDIHWRAFCRLLQASYSAFEFF